MVEGSSTVIQAVVSAKEAVSAIEAFLGTAKPEAANGSAQAHYLESHFDEIPRTQIREIPAAERVHSILVEDVAGFSDSEIQKEAFRCVSCGCLAVAPSDIAIALVALDASIVTTKRTLPAQAFFTATASCSTVLEQDELIKEVRIPKPPRGARQHYLKFTLRKPIDFALVSVASIITEKNGVCSDAHIALGAVAPSPMRAREAELAIKGKFINEKSAAEAAQTALAAVLPLTMNQYKVDIAKTLIERSILGIPE
jgi:CO/xanthine dehydrogenase FAD-binding subunit